MAPFLRLVAICFLLAVPLAADTQPARVVAGSVFVDRMSLALREHFRPAAGVTVKLYRDGGDGQPTADDPQVGTAKTNAAGVYMVRVDMPGTYWVSVDSRSFSPAGAWPEQTFGPAGSLCAHPDGSTRGRVFESPCFGGRRGGVSDDASSLATSEHVARVNVRESVTAVDFAFSFDAVVSTADSSVTMQGTLRQFLANAALLPGPNRMHFVPLELAPDQEETNYGVPPRWWRITLSSPLPELAAEDTVIDGTAYNFLSAASVANTNPGRLGERATVKPQERKVSRIERQELELVLNGTEGVVCTARCGLSSIALHGTPVILALRADARLEHVMVGATPDGAPAPAGVVGIQVEKGTTIARDMLVTSQIQAGVIVAREARIDGAGLEITLCGEPERGAVLVLLSDSSSIRSSNVSGNAGAGIILGSLDGKAPANGNAIDSSTISGNQAGIVIAPGSLRNAITRNDIMWNHFGGVTIAPFENLVPPRENRLSANRFDENGLRPVVLALDVEDPNTLARGAEHCERVGTAANGGIPVPRITSVRVLREERSARVVIRGAACPGEIVELYQSFVTSGIREKAKLEIPHVRRADSRFRETITNEERTLALPSIGEFNFLGATNTAGDGSFEASFPLSVVVPMERPFDSDDEETSVWALEVLPPTDASDRAFSAMAIDAAGNTSEMSVRQQAEDEEEEKPREKR